MQDDLLLQELFQRGKPLSHDLRNRIMLLVRQGYAPDDIAQRLLVSSITVKRYIRSAAVQNARVPQPKPQGGYTGSILQRDDTVRLGRILLENPKMTLDELREAGVQAGIFRDASSVSLSTVYRNVAKMDLVKKRAAYYDPKTVVDPYIVHERQAFRRAQREPEQSDAQREPQSGMQGDAQREQEREPQLALHRVLFFDETNVTPYEQATRAWAPVGQKPYLPRPKGKALGYTLMATMGLLPNDILVLHYKMYEPRRLFDPLPVRFEAGEFSDPHAGIDFGYCAADTTTTRYRAQEDI